MIIGAMNAQTSSIRPACLGRADRCRDIDTSLPQGIDTAAAHGRKGVGGRHDHPRDARSDDRGSAGGRLALMAAGLERDGERAAAGRIASHCKRCNFCMWAAEVCVPAFRNDSAAATGSLDHCPHHGIWFDAASAPAGQFQGPSHQQFVAAPFETACVHRFG